jgi:transposase
MDNITHLGLDVHKDTIAVAVLRPGDLSADQRVIANTPEALRKLVARCGDPASLLACYEAGPTGYHTHRILTSLGVRCDVIAPATDRLDARNLARLHRAGELTAIRIPTPTEEALRELMRTREDLKADCRIAHQRVKSFLLRQGRCYPAPRSGWTERFDRWVRSQRFDEPAAQAAFLHLLAAYSVRRAHLDSLDAEIIAAANLPELSGPVALLRCFRGIDTLSAVTLVTETCDFRRFGSAASFMAFTGLVPSEHSSGLSCHHGSITKTGNAHIRRVLVEAAWSYRHRPYVGQALAKRLQNQPPEIIAYSWAAQCRLTGRFRKLTQTKGQNKAVVAVARELSGFVWGMMTGRTAI